MLKLIHERQTGDGQTTDWAAIAKTEHKGEASYDRHSLL